MIPRSKIRNQPRWRYLWFSLALPVGLMLLLVGCAGPLSVPLERTPAIYVEPESAKPGSLVVVIGSQWQPNEVVLIDLVSVYEGEPISDTFAVARTGDDEIFIISFLFPTDERWTQADSVQVTAHSVASDREATADLSVVAPKVSGDTKQSILFPMVATGGKQPVSAPAVGTAQVSSSRVNLRAGPSTAYAVLTVLSPGTSFSVLGQSADADWLRIRLGSGLEGWVARIYTDFDATVPIIRVDLKLPETPAAVEGQIWLGEYYNNRTLEGKPALVRGDQNVKFDWAYAAPAATLPPDDFSARWTRLIYFPAGAYRFHLTFDDGVRMWIGNELVIDEWSETSLRTVSVERTFKTADARQIRIEYFEATERAHIDFWWERISNFPEWRGAYYDNDNLVGAPVLLRNDPAVDFTWGQDSPGAGVPRDNFSVRWMRTVDFDQDIYRFRAQMDDGLRLFVDGNLIIDEWHNGGAREVVANYALNKGLHAIRVEHREITGDATARVWWEKAGSLVAYPDWKGEYWPNTSLSGNPALVRNDPVLNFNWGSSSPGATIPPDNFSARWTRSVQFGSGTYRFHINVDDGVRMWIDDRLVVDEWREGSNRGITADYGLAEGMHTVRVEFYERIGDAMIDVWWEKVDQQSSFADWKGEYWPNRNLAGDPTVIRNDRTVDFEWGSGAAAPGLPSDRFSARWTRRIDFEPATYRIYARADDGVRVWVDDNRVIDQWQDSPGWEVYQADVRFDGRQRIKVEYYDRTGNALVEVWWQKLTDPPTTTPTAPVATPEPTPTEAMPTDTPEPEPTDTPEPTPTIATPTDTPEPTPSDRPEPQVSAVQNVESGNVEVVGSGFAQGTRLFVYLTMPDGARMPESIATAEADDGGQVNLTFAMPATWPDGAPVVAGPVTLMVATEDGAIELFTQLEYTPMQGPA